MISCYNCGEEDHYGDDCPEPRHIQLRFVDPSAFTGRSLSGKHRTKYDANLRKHKDKIDNKDRSRMYDDDYSSSYSRNDQYSRGENASSTRNSGYLNGSKRKYDYNDSSSSSSNKRHNSGYVNLPPRSSESYNDSRSNYNDYDSKRPRFGNAGSKISKKFRDFKDSTKRMFKRK